MGEMVIKLVNFRKIAIFLIQKIYILKMNNEYAGYVFFLSSVVYKRIQVYFSLTKCLYRRVYEILLFNR